MAGFAVMLAVRGLDMMTYMSKTLAVQADHPRLVCSRHLRFLAGSFCDVMLH